MTRLRWMGPILLLTAGIGGCGSQISATSTSARSGPVIIARHFLHQDEEVLRGLGAHGYVVFTSRAADPEDQERYKRVATAYLSHLDPVGREIEIHEAGRYLVTFWMLELSKETPLDDAAARDTAVLLEKYDYPRGKQVATRIGKVGARGPLLVAWKRGARSALVLDMSQFEIKEDFDRGFEFWRKWIVKDPPDWESFWFDIDRGRLELGVLADKYGGTILGVIKWLWP